MHSHSIIGPASEGALRIRLFSRQQEVDGSFETIGGGSPPRKMTAQMGRPRLLEAVPAGLRLAAERTGPSARSRAPTRIAGANSSTSHDAFCSELVLRAEQIAMNQMNRLMFALKIKGLQWKSKSCYHHSHACSVTSTFGVARGEESPACGWVPSFPATKTPR